MHEMAITDGIVNVCIEHAKGRRVTSVEIEIGLLSGVVTEAVEFCFDACTRDTALEGAALIVFKIPGLGYCKDCNKETSLDELYSQCTHCGGHQVSVLKGEEMRVKAIEVEE